MRQHHAHWIWLGSPPPAEMIDNVLTFRLLDLGREFNYHLWLDHDWIPPLGMVRDGLRIHRAASIFDAEPPCAALMAMRWPFQRERLGAFHNYAAASDILRYAVLYAMGGVYMDVDFTLKSMLALQKYHRWAQYSGDVWVVEDDFEAPKRYGTGVMIACPRNTLFRVVLGMLGASYKTIHSYEHKRWFPEDDPALRINPIEDDGTYRVNHTVDHTGPRMLARAAWIWSAGRIHPLPASDCFHWLDASGESYSQRPARMRHNSI